MKRISVLCFEILLFQDVILSLSQWEDGRKYLSWIIYEIFVIFAERRGSLTTYNENGRGNWLIWEEVGLLLDDKEIYLLSVWLPKKEFIKSIKKLDGTITTGRTNIIVVWSSEITNDNFLLFARNLLSKGNRRASGANEHLLHNFVDYLTGNYFVPEMKVKSLDFNPLEKTSDGKRFVLKIINMAVHAVAIQLP